MLIFESKSGLDKSEDWVKIKALEKGYWSINIDEVIVDGVSYEHNLKAIVDTGSSFLTLPLDSYQEVIRRKLNINSGCGTKDLPLITYKIKELYFSLKPSDYAVVAP